MADDASLLKRHYNTAADGDEICVRHCYALNAGAGEQQCKKMKSECDVQPTEGVISNTCAEHDLHCDSDNVKPPDSGTKSTTDMESSICSEVAGSGEISKTGGSHNSEGESDSISDISGMSDISMDEMRWTNCTLSGPVAWVQSQMNKGVDPRTLLKDLLPKDAIIPPDLEEFVLWKAVINMLVEPPMRRKLPHINTLEDVVHLIKKCSRIMVLTGAGVSVSCGIPDFRSKDGIYARLAAEYPDLPDPQAMFDIHYFKHNQKPFFKFAKEIYPGQFKPSTSHKFIQVMESQGKLLRNYTQNIDTLEQVAGIQNVIQCHGSFITATCMVCKRRVDHKVIEEDIMNQIIPHCSECPHEESLAIMKPDIVFFGESLPEQFHKQMEEDKENCDLLIVMGSSLKVRPVALIPNSLPEEVPQVLINREPLKHLNFDVELLGNCDDIISELCHRLGNEWHSLCDTQIPAVQVSRDEMIIPPLLPDVQDTGKNIPYISSEDNILCTVDHDGTDKTNHKEQNIIMQSSLCNTSDAGTSSQANDEKIYPSNRHAENNKPEVSSSLQSSNDPVIITENVCDSDSFSFGKNESDIPVLVECIGSEKGNVDEFVENMHLKVNKQNVCKITESELKNNQLDMKKESLQKRNQAAKKTELDNNEVQGELNKIVNEEKSDILQNQGDLDKPKTTKNINAGLFGKSIFQEGIDMKEHRGKFDVAKTPIGEGTNQGELEMSEAELKAMRQYWKPRFVNLGSQIKEGTFLFIPPNRYIFKGAEFLQDLDTVSEYSTDYSSGNSDGESLDQEDPNQIDIDVSDVLTTESIAGKNN